MTLTPKENTLLTDLKSQEQLCIEKYTKYAEMANDTELKNLFNNLKNNEQKHPGTNPEVLFLDTVDNNDTVSYGFKRFHLKMKLAT